MAAKTKKPEAPAPSDLWRLAEIMQMRRVDPFNGTPSYLKCQLCLSRAELTAEIEHKDGCPISRIKRVPD